MPKANSPSNDLERYEMLCDAVDQAFQYWNSWSKEQRRYLASLIYNGLDGFLTEEYAKRAYSKVQTHQRLFTEMLRVKGEYDDMTGGRTVELL